MRENPQVIVNRHIEKLTKKYLLDYLNTLFFSQMILWDGDDQFNELPIFASSNDAGYKVEQRGCLLVDKHTSRAVRVLVTATESTVQRVCYRVVGLKEPTRIDEGNRLYYPLEGQGIDLSISDLSLGSRDPSSYSFCDNTQEDGQITNSRLFTVLRHVLGSAFLAIDTPELFNDILKDNNCLPPLASDAHYKPIHGVKDPTDRWSWANYGGLDK